ncbi:MAG: hypothetical protein WBL88_02635 [Nitrososphaeraceae archaeon]
MYSSFSRFTLMRHIKRMLQSHCLVVGPYGCKVEIHESGYSGTIKFYREVENNTIDQLMYLGAHVGNIRSISEDKALVADFYLKVV